MTKVSLPGLSSCRSFSRQFKHRLHDAVIWVLLLVGNEHVKWFNTDTRSCLDDTGYCGGLEDLLSSLPLVFCALTWSRKSRLVVWIDWRRIGILWAILYCFCFISRRRETWRFEHGANIVVGRYRLMRLYLPLWNERKNKFVLFACCIITYTNTSLQQPFANRDYRLCYSFNIFLDLSYLASILWVQSVVNTNLSVQALLSFSPLL